MMRAYTRRQQPPKPAEPKKVTFCLPCGVAGKPEPATTTVDGDPMCTPCSVAAKKEQGAEHA